MKPSCVEGTGSSDATLETKQGSVMYAAASVNVQITAKQQKYYIIMFCITAL